MSATYATVSDVEALAPYRKIGEGNNPSQRDVEVILELVEAEINAILVNKGYQVPVEKAEAPLAFQFLRRIVAQGAVAQIEQSAGNGPNVERSEKVYQQSLKLIVEAREIMVAPQNQERDKPRGPGVTSVGPVEEAGATYGSWESNPVNPLTPFFQRNLQF
jgi:hypothetical protein